MQVGRFGISRWRLGQQAAVQADDGLVVSEAHTGRRVLLEVFAVLRVEAQELFRLHAAPGGTSAADTVSGRSRVARPGTRAPASIPIPTAIRRHPTRRA